MFKFIYSEKGTKFCRISSVDLTVTTYDESTIYKIVWPSQNIWSLPIHFGNYVPQWSVELVVYYQIQIFILLAESSQSLLKVTVISIHLTFMYLVALNLLINNQFSSHHCGTELSQIFSYILSLSYLFLFFKKTKIWATFGDFIIFKTNLEFSFSATNM